jgi:hypothetical protein
MGSPRIDRIESNSALAGALASANGITTLVDPTIAQISVPNTTIIGRASIPDITQDLAVSFGVNRIPVQSIYQLQTEFGPNGEPVWGVAGDTLGLIRFIGSGWTSGPVADGQPISTAVSGDYCEITFYGTNLNLLCDLGYSSLNMLAAVDGGANGANIFAAAYSTILDGRNYNTNQIISPISSQTLGVHTVKLTNNSTNAVKIHGFEVLNTNSLTSLSINKGKAFGNQSALTLAANTTSLYNSGFESGSLGAKGGHVVTYLKSDGTIGKVVTPTDTTALYTTSASHTNEEVVRRYNFREFSASRSDDFGTNGTAINRAFTLDDGTTTLVGTNITFFAPAAIGNTQEVIVPSNTSAYIAITFVGTGLDIHQSTLNLATDAHTLVIDGTTITASFTGTQTGSTLKIASGLPYGTHVVRITRNVNVNYGIAMTGFTVYQPKKPTLPTGAIELTDYNVMATYIANTVTGLSTIGTGVLRKQNLRENTFVGAWTITGVDANTYIGGWDTFSNTAANYHEYTFFGTGFELRGYNTVSSTANATISLQNLSSGGSLVTLNSTNFPGLTTSGYGSVFTYATGNLNESSGGVGSGISINGLTLGLYKVRFTIGTGFMEHQAIDVITPIHSAKSNSIYDAQNTLPVGSCALKDARKFGVSAAQTKNVSQAFGIASGPTTTSTTLIPMPEMNVTHLNVSGRIKVSYSVLVSNSTAGQTTMSAIFVDGVKVSKTKRADANGAYEIINDEIVVFVSAGIHKIDIYWQVSGGTGNCIFDERNILVEEI